MESNPRSAVAMALTRGRGDLTLRPCCRLIYYWMVDTFQSEQGLFSCLSVMTIWIQLLMFNPICC